jgi:hypothetical protein
VVGITLLALALLGGALYAFGGPQGPTREQRAEYDALRAQGVVLSRPESQFVVPVPGCVCHSTDPVQIVHHAEYRLRDCASCH